MAKQTVNIGSSPNDGTGDTVRSAMDKINDNFDEVYSSLSFGSSNNLSIANTVLIGNSTINSVANSSTIKFSNSTVSTNINIGNIIIGNSTVNTSLTNSTLSIGANVSTNTSTILIGNSTINSVANSSIVRISNSTLYASIAVNNIIVGNSTVNSTSNNTTLVLSNSTVNSTLSLGSLKLGNSTVNSTLNSTSLSVSSNTFTLGSSTDSANGYTYLPNGFKLNWGWVSANSSDGNVTFTAAYSTNVYSVTATSNTSVATYQASVIDANNTVALIRTANTTSTNVYWMAIGK